MIPVAPAHELAAAVRAGTHSAREVCDAALERIAATDAQVGAFLEILPDAARAAADQVDAALAAGQDPGPLAGVPIALKDNICTLDGHTTCASRILTNFRAPYEATAVTRLRSAGAVIVGKLNLDEFAMGSSTENSGVQPSRNPWNLEHVPGGSSGGSAVAVAARMVPVSLGSDTGGSIRQPAGFCGVLGMKPTYGRVSRYGLVAFGSSLDQIGPLASCVEDIALLQGVISGHDARDATSVTEPVPDFRAALADDQLSDCLRGLKIGRPAEYFGPGLADNVEVVIDAALKQYARLGAEIVDVSLPHTQYCVATYYLLATAEASSNLARYDGVRYGQRSAESGGILELYSNSREAGLGQEPKRRIMLGTFALSAGYYDDYYDKALRVRRLIKQDFDRAFERVHVVAAPVAPSAAFKLGAKIDDPLQMYLADIFSVAANLAGVPSLALPCGFTAGGLPVGFQLIGPLFGEPKLLQVARLFERETDYHTRIPPVAAVSA